MMNSVIQRHPPYSGTDLTTNNNSNDATISSVKLSYYYWSLLVFIVLDISLLLVLRMQILHSNDYIYTTAVFYSEQIKLIFSILMCFIFDAKCSVNLLFEILVKGFIVADKNSKYLDIFRLCIPAILYTIQNNLQYIIDTSTLFQVLYQFKIISAALFSSVIIESRKLNYREWFTIIGVCIGVSMVCGSQKDIHPHHAHNIIGILSVFTACMTSGLAGILFEKIIKSSQSSIWVLNIQLSIISILLSSIECYMKDKDKIQLYGFNKGYDMYVIFVILCQAAVGLSVAMVVKYADNIHKGFASSISIMIACVIEAYTFGETIIKYDAFFTGSLFIVICSAIFLHQHFKYNYVDTKLVRNSAIEQL